LHTLPELVTTVVGGVGGVEGEWFGGAAINKKFYIVQASLSQKLVLTVIHST